MGQIARIIDGVLHVATAVDRDQKFADGSGLVEISGDWRPATDDEASAFEQAAFGDGSAVDGGFAPDEGGIFGGGVFGGGEPPRAEPRETIPFDFYDTLITREDGFPPYNNNSFLNTGRARAFDDDEITFAFLLKQGLVNTPMSGSSHNPMWLKAWSVQIAGDFSPAERRAIVTGVFAQPMLVNKPMSQLMLRESAQHPLSESIIELGCEVPKPDATSIMVEKAKRLVPLVFARHQGTKGEIENAGMIAAAIDDAIRETHVGIEIPARMHRYIEVWVSESARAILAIKCTMFRVIMEVDLTRDVQ